MEHTTIQIADLMTWATRRMRHQSAKELAPLGLTPGQSRTLRIVMASPGPFRMVDIATRLGVVPRAATSLVDGLEGLGLVERELDPRDRRAILIHLTERGRDLRDRLDAARTRAAQAVLRPLSAADQTELLRLLRLMCGPCCEERP